MKWVKFSLVGVIVAFSYLFSADHLLITEICVLPTEAEFIEIYNPTDREIDLSYYYLTDATYANGGNFYYNLPLQNGTAGAAGPGNYSDFNAKFPDGSSIGPKEFRVIAFRALNFKNTYGFDPDFEIISDETNDVPDMIPAEEGSIDGGDYPAGLSNSGEVVVLYYWDGVSDIVQDVDYIVWGDKAEAVCKTGVSIDGPDGDSSPTQYKDDTPIAGQIPISTDSPHSSGKSVGRVSYEEYEETQSGGNGITGHDETSENLSLSFQEQDPNPGSGPAVGAPVIVSIEVIPTLPSPSEEVIIKGKFEDDGLITSAKVYYSWGDAPGNSSEMFDGGDGYWYGTLPAFGEGNVKVFYRVKVTDDEQLSAESEERCFYVRSSENTDIAYIQDNIDEVVGQIFTVAGVVTIGSGKISNTTTQVYIQDGSGKGINLFCFEFIEGIERGDSLIVTGVAEQYFSTTELKDFAFVRVERDKSVEPLDFPRIKDAKKEELEGTYISLYGRVVGTEVAGSGRNYALCDGEDTIVVRINDCSGVDTSAIFVESAHAYQFSGVLNIYRDEFQLIVAYDSDVVPLISVEKESGIAYKFRILDVYPNPFNSTSRIWFDIGKEGEMSLSVYSLNGDFIREVVSGYKAQGRYTVVWDGRDANGNPVSSGIYLLVLRAGNVFDVRKITYLK